MGRPFSKNFFNVSTFMTSLLRGQCDGRDQRTNDGAHDEEAEQPKRRVPHYGKPSGSVSRSGGVSLSASILRAHLALHMTMNSSSSSPSSSSSMIVVMKQ